MAASRTTAKFAALLCGAVAAGFASASAQELAAPPESMTPGVSFDDPEARLAQASALGVSIREDAPARFSNLGPADDAAGSNPHQYELALTAEGQSMGVPLDLSIAQRGSIGSDEAGDLNRQGRGSEVRVGRGLSMERRSASSEPTWYVFAASDDEAVTWNPGARSDFGGQGTRFALQDRVEIGDMQAGVTYERNGVQASIAYVEREVSTYVGVQTVSQDENFAGFTLTMKR